MDPGIKRTLLTFRSLFLSQGSGGDVAADGGGRRQGDPGAEDAPREGAAGGAGGQRAAEGRVGHPQEEVLHRHQGRRGAQGQHTQVGTEGRRFTRNRLLSNRI